jgi:hypothetical protein
MHLKTSAGIGIGARSERPLRPPVEVVPFGWHMTARSLSSLAAKPSLRRNLDNSETARLCCFPVGQVGNLQRVANPLGAMETGRIAPVANRRAGCHPAPHSNRIIRSRH